MYINIYLLMNFLCDMFYCAQLVVVSTPRKMKWGKGRRSRNGGRARRRREASSQYLCTIRESYILHMRNTQWSKHKVWSYSIMEVTFCPRRKFVICSRAHLSCELSLSVMNFLCGAPLGHTNTHTHIGTRDCGDGLGKHWEINVGWGTEK